MLKIHEIFYSLQGEAKTAGVPTVFVRLTGCPMRCSYCDTEYAFYGGEKQSIAQIVEHVQQYPTTYVTITGGEPLAQSEVYTLMKTLCDKNYQVSLETGNAMAFQVIDPRIYVVLDIKTPASKEHERNHYANLEQLKSTDTIKFVICDEPDYLWSVEQVKQRGLTQICEVLFSPAAEQMPPQQLADWILRDGLNVRFQVQLHKILWGDEPGR